MIPCTSISFGPLRRLITVTPNTARFSVLICLCLFSTLCYCSSAPKEADSQERFFALPIGSNEKVHPKAVDRYGVPFIETEWHPPANGPLRVEIGAQVARIFFLGMTESAGVQAWSDPRDYSQRFFVGDNLGDIRINYADGSTQDFPLILGESVWWGVPFYQYQNPYPTDEHFRAALALSLHLYPAAPVEDSNYVAAIVPRSSPIRSLEIVSSPAKKGSVVIAGITAETRGNDEIAGATALPPGNSSPEFSRFLETKTLRATNEDEGGAQQRLNNLSHALYTSDTQFDQPVRAQIPPGYSGPLVSFKGNAYASILQNAFYANIQDMLAKIDPDGTYHTSTRGAISWGPYGFGTFQTNSGPYYDHSWSRDMGRSLLELTELGYLNPASRTADYSFRMARLWEENPSLKYKGESLPPHWTRIINKPNLYEPFENDGHGLVSLFLFKLWQRLPNHDEWLRSHWKDVKAAGDWILWQFDHPAISGAANGVLHTTGESSGIGNDLSVYPDSVCMTALEALAQMADSIGETQSAAQWRDRAAKMRTAIATQYMTTDQKYGRVWKLYGDHWPAHATVLGPMIISPDFQGIVPEDDDLAWRPVNEATYQRLIDTYQRFGFYGWAMGYLQGFVTQSALLLDRMDDATTMLDWVAKQIYDPRFGSFVVPEGVQLDPTGHFWYRTGDLGNGVQEAEIVKTFRILIGVDDTHPSRLQLVPRMPFDWKSIQVDKYPVLFETKGKPEVALMHYKLERLSGRINLEVAADKDLGPVAVRLGPFKEKPAPGGSRINGRPLKACTAEQSGDSWWIKATVQIGPTVSKRPASSGALIVDARTER